MQAVGDIGPVPHRAESNLDFFDFLPCVVYECTPSWKLTYVSSNVVDLLGFEAKEILDEDLPLSRKVFEYDLDLFQQKLDEVKRHGSANLIHRFLARSGLPIWVHHRLQKSPGRQDLIRGCLLHVPEELRFEDSGSGAVELFIHKLGNHFTLLQMLVTSLKRELPSSREAEIFYETIGRAIELTRGFADYHQQPSHRSGRVCFAEILDGVLTRVKYAALEKIIAWEQCIDEPTRRIFLKGDPLLLELALGHILQNAIEASAPRDQIIIRAETYRAPSSGTRIKICIDDFGAGIEPEHVTSVFRPFFTTKRHHQGLGLTIARRYVEIHGGFLRLTSVFGEGTKAEINLPADSQETNHAHQA